MPTGHSMAYISGGHTDHDHLDLPRATDGYRRTHTPTSPRRTSVDWDALTPSCKGCATKSGQLNRAGKCPTCEPRIITQPPTEEKSGKLTTRRSAPRATSTNGDTRRARVVGPSTTEEKDPAVVQEMRPATTAGTSDLDLDLGRELGRAARLLSESHDNPSPAVQALRGRVLGVLDALEAFLDATRDRPTLSAPASSQPAAGTPVAPDPMTGPDATPRAARSTPRHRATPSWAKPVDEQTIVREYVDDLDSCPVIAARHGIGDKRVRTILDRHHVVRRDDRHTNSGGSNAKTIDDYDPTLVADIRRLYVDEQQTAAHVAEAVGHTPKFVCTVLERAGIPRRPAASVGGRKGRDPVIDIKSWAVRQGLLVEIQVGLPPMRVVQAYAAAHPPIDTDDQEAPG